MEELTGFRLKIVERAGVKLERVLHKSNPWAGQSCERENCLLCATKLETEKDLGQSCSKRNLVYETWCQTCKLQDEERAIQVGKDPKKIPLFKYIGESSRSCFERGWEHQYDALNYKQGSHMLKHALTEHDGIPPEEVKFLMRAMKFHTSAYSRQMHEAVAIQVNRGHNLLNSKAEYNRCALPRLTMKLGEKSVKELEKDLKEEKKKDDLLESKIKDLKRARQKEKAKKRAPARGQPKRKKPKLGGVDAGEKTVIVTSKVEKRKPPEDMRKEEEAPEPARKKRKNQDIRSSFLRASCKGICLEDSKEMLALGQSEQSVPYCLQGRLCSGSARPVLADKDTDVKDKVEVIDKPVKKKTVEPKKKNTKNKEVIQKNLIFKYFKPKPEVREVCDKLDIVDIVTSSIQVKKNEEENLI